MTDIKEELVRYVMSVAEEVQRGGGRQFQRSVAGDNNDYGEA